MPIRFFADHCVPTSACAALRDAGHEVLILRDHLPTNATDPEVITAAQDHAAVLLTLNGDFSDIVTYPPGDYLGIVALQLRNHPEVLGQILTRLIEYIEAHPEPEHFGGKLLLVEAHRIRVRRKCADADSADEAESSESDD